MTHRNHAASLARGAALALALAACGEDTPTGSTSRAGDAEVVASGSLVHTPSGATFYKAEWDAMRDRASYLIPASEWARRLEEGQDAHAGTAVRKTLTTTAVTAPRVLCHFRAAFVCNSIKQLFPAALPVSWTDAQWAAASVADFEQFHVIYVHDFAWYQNATLSYDSPNFGNTSFGAPGIANSKAVWSQAVTGRVALTGFHFEHCDPAHGNDIQACNALRKVMTWVTGVQGTGIIASSQIAGGGTGATPSQPAWLPAGAPFDGVAYAGNRDVSNEGAYDWVQITEPGHETMAGLSNALLSDFQNTSHSYFTAVGSFTSVA